MGRVAGVQIQFQRNEADDVRLEKLRRLAAAVEDLDRAQAQLKNNSVSDSVLRDSAPCSVIGRAVDSTGSPADIRASFNNTILRRVGDVLGFGTITSSFLTDFDEAAQDAVGNILSTSAEVAFLYTDLGSPTITASVIPGSVGLTKLAPIASSSLLGRVTAGTGSIEVLSVAQVVTLINASLDHGTLLGLSDDDHPQYTRKDTLTARGDLYARDASTVTRLALGTDRQFLRANTTDPAWETVSPVITLGTDLTGNVTLTNLASATLNATVANDAVTNAKLANMAQSTIKGRAEGAGTGDPTDLTAAQVMLIIDQEAVTWTGQHDWAVALRGPNGTAATPSFGFTSNAGLGGYRINSNQLGFSANSILQLEVGDSYSDAKTQWRWTGVNSPAQITANTNDYTGAAGSFTVVRFSTDAARNITGATGGVAGRLVLFSNIGTQTAVFTNNDAASAAANRFLNATGTNKTVQAGGSILYWYDGTSTSWRQVASIA